MNFCLAPRWGIGGGLACWATVACTALVAILVGCLGGTPAAASPLVDIALADGQHGCPPVALPSGAATPEATLLALHAARCALEAGQWDRAREIAPRLQTLPPGIGEAMPWTREVGARVALVAGRHAEAADLFDGLVARGEQERTSTAARGRWTYYSILAREAAVAAGNGDLVDPTLVARRRSFLREHPSSAYAARLAVWEPLDTPSPRARIDMAVAALRGRHYDACERLLRWAACAGGRSCTPLEAVRAGDPARYEAAWQVGFLLYRFRREYVDQALPWLQSVASVEGPRQRDAAYTWAAAVERMERLTEARRAWQAFASQAPDDPRAGEARLRAAILLVHAQRDAEAIDALQRWIERHPGHTDQPSATRWLAWSQFRSGDCAAALRTWARMQTTPAMTTEARYWSGVCEDQLGRPEQARALWTDVAAADPFAWYGLLARQRLGLPLVATRPPRREPPSTPTLWRDLVALGRAGLAAEAQWLAAQRGLEAPSDAVAMHALARRSDWVRWIRAYDARRDGAALLQVPPDPSALERLRFAAPVFYEDAVQQAAGREQVLAEMIWAVMQRESGYDPGAISVSDAMGLMQVIPQTAEKIAISLGEGYRDGQLFAPAQSIRFGAWYLGQLQHRFADLPGLAAGAYNAGPLAMETWVQRSGGRPYDVFVEEIAYDQARNYIKGVTGVTVRYLVANGNREVLESPTLANLLPERAPTEFRPGLRW